MNLEDLKEIEKKYDFNYPELYYRLLNDGMLDWGVTKPGWYKTEFPKLKGQPPFLLFAEDFEIISSKKEIMEEIDAFADEDDYRQTKKEFHNKFIPFGKTGAGDLYCFFLNNKNNIQSIILVWHDSNEVDILSENLEDFTYRQLLECVIEPYEEGLIMSGDFKENINNQLSTHKEYISNGQRNILQEIYKRKMDNGLLTREEAKEILSKLEIKNNSFEYQEEEYRETKQRSITLSGERHHIEYRLSIISLPKSKLQFIKEVRKISKLSISDLLKLNETPLVVYKNTLSLYKELKLENFTSSDKDVLLHLSELYSNNIKLEYKKQIEKDDDYKELK